MRKLFYALLSGMLIFSGCSSTGNSSTKEDTEESAVEETHDDDAIKYTYQVEGDQLVLYADGEKFYSYDEYYWPTTGFLSRIPEYPGDADYISVYQSENMGTAEIPRANKKDFNTFKGLVEKAGFDKEVIDNAGFYSAENEDGEEVQMFYGPQTETVKINIYCADY